MKQAQIKNNCQKSSLQSVAVTLYQKIISFVLIFLLSFQPALSYGTAIVDGTSQTSVDTALNGVEIVNIAPANNQGVSVNNYNQFDVDETGMVLNNSDQVGVSQLAGSLYANPNYQSGDGATVILNQVTSSKESYLRGYTEIFGKKAAYILANPNGIQVKGAGFINTNEVNLITGTAQITNGIPSQFDLGKGKLLIEAGSDGKTGLEATGAHYLRLISRIHDIRANILAGENLEVLAGNGSYDFDQKLIHSLELTDDGENLAINALGSMYAGNIRLIASEKGLGVNAANDLVAEKGQIEINAQGDLVYKNASAQANINIQAENIEQTNQGYSLTGSINLSANQAIKTTGSLIAQNHIKLKAKNDITLNQSADISYLVADKIEIDSDNTASLNHIQLLSSNLSILAKTLKMNADHLQTDSAVINVDQFNNYSEWLVNTLHLNSQNLHNFSTGSLIDQNNLWNLNISDHINNEGILWKNADFSLQTKNIINDGILGTDAKLSIINDSLINNHLMQASDSLDIDTQTLTNKGDLLANDQLSLITNSLNNHGTIPSAKDLILDGTIDNHGNLLASQNLTIKGSKLTNQKLAYIQANEQINLNSDQTDNFGIILAKGNLNLNGANLINQTDGQIQTEGDFESTGTIDNQGIILVSQNTSMNGGLTNQGTFITQNNFSYSSSSTLTNSGYLEIVNKTTINNKQANIDNQGNWLNHNDLNVLAKTLTNSGNIQIKTDSNMITDNLTQKTNGVIQADNLTLDTANQTDNAGILLANQKLSLIADALTNQKDSYIQSSNSVDLNINQIDNRGVVLASQDLKIGGTNLNNKTDGVIQANDLTLNSNQTDNSGIILAKKDLNLNGANLSNQTDGKIKTDNNLIASSIINNLGTIFSTKNNTINNKLTNQGALITQADFTYTGDSLTNTGHIETLGKTTLNNNQAIIDNQGTWLNHADLTILAQSLTNQSRIETKGDSTINLNDWNNKTQGQWINHKTASITAHQLTNQGWLISQGKLDLEITNNLKNEIGSLKNQGNWLVEADMELDGGNFSNSGQMNISNPLKTAQFKATNITDFNQSNQFSANHIEIQSTNLNNNGQLVADNSFTLSTDSLNLSTDGHLQANQINITTTNFNNSGKIIGENTNLSVSNNLNQQASGKIYANNDLSVSGHWQSLAGNIYGKQNLNISSDNLTLNNSNVFGSLGNIVLTLTGNFINQQEQNSDGNLKINAQNITNKAKLAFGNLTLRANNSLTNENVLLYGKNLLDIEAGSINLKGTLQSDNQLWLTTNQALTYQNFNFEGGSGQNKLSVNGDLNFSNSLQTRGSLSINATNLNTNGNMLASQNNLNIAANQLNNQSYGFIYAGDNMNLDINSVYNYQSAEIYAGNNLDIHKNNARNTMIHNSAGYIESGGQMQLKTANLTNTYSGNLTIGKVYSNQSISYLDFPYDPHWKYRHYAWTHTKTENLWKEMATGSYQKGNIVANNNLLLDVTTIHNQYSTLRSNQNMQMINVATINNTSQSLKEQYWLKEPGPIKWDNNAYKKRWRWRDQWHAVATEKVSIQQRESGTKIGGSISAAGSITGNVNGINNGISAENISASANKSADFNAQNASIVSVAQNSGIIDPLDLLTEGNKQKEYTFDDYQTSITKQELKTEPTITNQSVDNKKLIANQKLKENQKPKGTDEDIHTIRGSFKLAESEKPDNLYVIESRTEFTDTSQFIASGYFLERINYDPHAEGVKLFADAFSEQKLIARSIEQITHQQFLNNQIQSMNEQMKALYQGAIEAYEDMDLSLGIKLTKEQIAALKKDMIWYEQEIINGKETLVPKIYLTKATRDQIKIHNGSVILANTIDLDVSGDINNSGIISADNQINLELAGDFHNLAGVLQSGKDLKLSAQNIINQTPTNQISWFTGSRETNNGIYGNNVYLSAKDKLENIGATIQSKNNLWLEAKSINNQSTYSSKQFNPDDQLSAIDSIAKIKSNKDLIIQADHLKDKAGKIEVKENLIAHLKGDISFDTIALKEKRFSNEGGFEVKRQSINHQVSQLNVSGDTQIISEGIISLIGSQVNLQKDANILAAKGYIQQSALNQQSEQKIKTEHSSNLLGSTKKVTTINSSSQTNQSSNLIVGGKLNLESFTDVNLIASNIKANQGEIKANHFNLVSAKDSNQYQRTEQKSGGFLKIGDYKNTTQQSNQNNIKTIVEVNSNLNIKTIKTELIASEIKAKTIEITTDSLKLVSDKDTQFTASFSDKSGLVTRKIKDQGKQSETKVASTIKANQILLNNQQIINPQNIQNQIIQSLSSEQELTNQLKEKGINLETITLNNKEWNKSITTLSQAGSIIVQLISATIPAGSFVNGIQNEAINKAVNTAINSMVKQASAQLMSSAITGQSPNFDLEAMTKNAVVAGLNQYVNQNLLSDALNQNFNLSDYAKNALVDGSMQGLSSKITGGDFKDGFKQGAGLSLVSSLSSQMRKNVSDNFETGSGEHSEGMYNRTTGQYDGKKVAGGHQELKQDGKLQLVGAPLGGSQTEEGMVLGLEYEKGNIIDRTLESFAGPHDYLASWNYENTPNNQTYLKNNNLLANVWSGITIPVAAPFALSTVLQNNLDTIRQYQQQRANDKQLINQFKENFDNRVKQTKSLLPSF